jgi:hypothetical protein
MKTIVVRPVSIRVILLDSLRDELFPVLNHLGYQGPRHSTERVKGRTADSFDFAKTMPDGRRFVLAIEVKSFERPTFDIYGGEVPVEGIKLLCPEETIPAERVDAAMLEVRNHLLPEARTGYMPFRTSLLAGWIDRDNAVKVVVSNAREKLPELVRFIELGKASRYVWSWKNRK